MTAPASRAHLVEPLTERQRLVLSLIAKGYTNPQIADELGVTIDGAKWHVREILSKLGVDSREEAARWWREEQRIDRRLQRTVRGIAGSVALRWMAASLAGVVGLVAVVIALQAAVRTAEEAPAPSPPPPGASSTPGAPGTPSAGGGLRVTHYGPNNTLDQPGMYFLNTQTGAIEGWSVDGAAAGEWWWYWPSPDNRLIAAINYIEGSSGFLVDRVSGNSYEFDSREWTPMSWGDQPILTTHAATVVLIQRTATAQPAASIRLVDVAQGTEHDIPTDRGSLPFVSNGTFAPDGRHLAAWNERGVYWLDIDTGNAVPVLRDEDPLRISIAPRHRGVVIREDTSFMGRKVVGALEPQLLDWTGNLQPYNEPGGMLSPDETLIARWQEVIPSRMSGPGEMPVLGYAEVIDARTGMPRFRLLGALLNLIGGAERWLSDSSGVVLNTTEGYAVFRPNGELGQRLPATGGWFDWPIPSPDDPSLFALGIGGFVRNGEAPVRFPPVNNVALSPALSPWGTTSKEVRLELHQGGKDWGEPAPLLAPVIQFAPYSGPPQLMVSNTGDCLNLRERPGADAPIRSCYPDGTIAEPATTTVPLWNIKDGDSVDPYGIFGDATGQPWIYLRMPDGVEGWASAEFLAWAP